MLQNTQTLGRVYDRRSNSANTSVFSVEATALTAPQLLEISHQKRKDGTVDTVCYITSDKRPTPDKNLSRVRTQVKFSYNPLEGRSDIQTEIAAQIAELTKLYTDSLPSILNREV